MGKQTRTIGLLALAGFLVLSAATFVIVSNERAQISAIDGLIVSTRTLPEDHVIAGEARIGTVLHALTPVHEGLATSGKPDALNLRLRDAQARYYDMDIGRAISLTGLAPRTPVSVSSGANIIYNNVPADWNGRIVLDTPADAPFEISFTQNDHDYRIGIMTRIGGSS